jgi:hypothetical protein
LTIVQQYGIIVSVDNHWITSKGITMKRTKGEHTIALSLDSEEALREFSQTMASIGVGVFKADALDREWYGRAPKNSYVLRTLQFQGKAKEQLVS